MRSAIPTSCSTGPTAPSSRATMTAAKASTAWLEYSAPAAGAYYLEVRGFVQETLRAATLSDHRRRNRASAETAEYLTATSSKAASSTIGAAGDVDWFGIELIEGRPYRFNLEGVDRRRARDPLLTLYDANGSQVASRR